MTPEIELEVLRCVSEGGPGGLAHELDCAPSLPGLSSHESVRALFALRHRGLIEAQEDDHPHDTCLTVVRWRMTHTGREILNRTSAAAPDPNP